MALLVGHGCGGSDAKSSDKEITSFALQVANNPALAADVTGTISGTNIALTVPSGTAVTSLVPTVAVSAGASVSPASGAAQNFTSPVTYTVTAADGSTKAFAVTVTVTPAASSAKDITQFTISAVDGVIGGTHVAVALTAGPVTSLTPTIAVSPDATVNPASGVAQDFTNPVTYTVTAQDSTTKDYVVSVSSSTTQKNITLFSILGVDGTITTGGGSSAGTVALALPSGTNLTNLTPTIALTSGATVSPASGAVQDFTNPVTYVVTNPASAGSGGTTKTWNVTVTAP
ncbi:MAG: hypothetical protein A2V77_09870 [Anaeromyxobacter sp. RBG_16_69_14]|nr:MAG: hypothetical protein A2V77_09870 [Anaeromyxobacter sp. RBG_16_69_14]